MQNLRKLSVLTITFLCANYFSTLAQGEQRAFKEGDKIASVYVRSGFSRSGLSGAMGGMSYEAALKGTNGLLSIGGFIESGAAYKNFYSLNSNLNNSTSSILVKDITAGLKFALHYSPSKRWDLYAGTRIGATYSSGIINSGTILLGDRPINGGNTLDKLNLLIDPFIGTRYYVSKKVGFQFEINGKGQSTFGLVFKF